jgi:3-deoxy-D-manno-octulosonate 8-phosphate phosphatase (KDO 8-P phosphatase)
MPLPKLILTDIDGVWTDGGMYYDALGNELKKFNTSDSAGVLFCNLLNIEFGIITGEDTTIVKRRAEKLKVKHLYMGVSNKVKVANDLINQLNISFKDVAYIGDDINDLELLRKVGISACPINAPEYIKTEVDYIIPKKGGDGAFRLFVETLLTQNNKLKTALELYFKSNKFNQ